MGTAGGPGNVSLPPTVTSKNPSIISVKATAVTNRESHRVAVFPLPPRFLDSGHDMNSHSLEKHLNSHRQKQ